MPAGYEMDALVLASVVGVMACRDGNGKAYKLGAFQENEPVPNYSGDISAAWSIVEKIKQDGKWMSIATDMLSSELFSEWICEFMKDDEVDFALGDTAPLAICRAVLLATRAV